MAIMRSTGPIFDFIKKYKFVALVVAVGVILMMLPSFPDMTTETQTTQTDPASAEDTEEKLEEILQQIYGAGNVSVMLTKSTGEEIVYQVDTNDDEGNDVSKKDTTTVIVTDQNRSESGLIRQVNPPKYLGAVVVCQGADDPKVRLAITDAVSKITGLGANNISVLKMK